MGEETGSGTWLFAQATKPERGALFCLQTIFSYLCPIIYLPRSLDRGKYIPLGIREDFPWEYAGAGRFKGISFRIFSLAYGLFPEIDCPETTPAGPPSFLPPGLSQSSFPIL